ncbi:MAG: hypothetical protein ACTTK0_00360 [Stomatobaculum sp.]
MRHTQNRSGVSLFRAALLLSALSLLLLWQDGFLREQLEDWRFFAMLAELSAVFGLLALTNHMISAPQVRRGAILFLICAFLWLHRVFLPILTALGWCAALVLIGEVLLLFSRRRAGGCPPPDMTRLSRDFLVGCAFCMAFFCGLSALGAGGPGTVRRAAALIAALALLFFLLFRISGLFPPVCVYLPPEHAVNRGRGRIQEEASEKAYAYEAAAEKSGVMSKGLFAVGSGSPSGRTSGLWWSAFMTLLLLHAGRLNITVDYDSLHYGLRSFYILDNGRGIYENLGSVNAVYFYPKGLELLTLPLSGTSTYGFVLAFSFCCALLLLLLTRSMVSRVFGRSAGFCAMFVIACIPGVMNLSTSAKTDMVTLLFQLIFINELLNCADAREKRQRWIALFWGLCALMLTLTLKPTAVVFSGGLALSALLFFVFRSAARPGIPDRKERKQIRRQMLLPVFFSGFALLGVTLRTLLLTGYPLVSVFTGLWERLGMHGCYPVAAQELPNAAAGCAFAESVRQLGFRLFLLLAAPVGEEGLHIRIAWGTVLFPLLLLAAAAKLDQKRGSAKNAIPSGENAVAAERRSCPIALQYLLWTMGVLLVLDAVSLQLLYQVDGNYYNLSYTLAVICAAALWRGEDARLLRFLSPALATAVFFMGISNWAGVRGLTEPKLNHWGFYDHRADIQDYMILGGSEPIYRYLSNGARIRLLAMAKEPECYFLPCSAESYADLEGSGGNVRLVKTLDEFKEYLEYAEITHLFAEDLFLVTHGRAEEMIRYMNEDGSITPLICQEGNTLYEYHPGIRD